MRALRLAAPLLGCALAACDTPVVGVELQLVARACSGAAPAGDVSHDPAFGVDTLRLKVTGDGLSPVTVTAPFADGRATVPNLPLGTNRRVVAEALKGGLVRARADSGKFDLLETSELKLTLFLRVVDAFTLTGGAAAGACTTMAFPRAGHAMTLLPDGKVLITGGFAIGTDGALRYRSEAEQYDPQTGTFTALTNGPTYRRAGHAALPVQLGSKGTGVFLAGGEGPSDPATGQGATVALKPMELFLNGLWSAVPPGAATPARTHQSAAVDVKTGFVVMAGGLAGPDVPGALALDEVSWFDPQQGLVKDAAQPLDQPTSDAVAIARDNKPTGGSKAGGMVLLGGRGPTGAATAKVSGVVYNGVSYVPDHIWDAPALRALPAPRLRHAAGRTRSDGMVVAGGVSAYSATDPYATAVDTITAVEPVAGYIEDAPVKLSQARADACGTSLESGEFLLAGGAAKQGGANLSSAAVDLIQPDGRDATVRTLRGPGGGGSYGLQMARHRAACLRLADGTVLVTGGLQFSGAGTPIALDSAEVFTPAGQ